MGIFDNCLRGIIIYCAGYELLKFVISRWRRCAQVAVISFIGYKMLPVIAPVIGFAYEELSDLLKAIKEMSQKSTCRTVDKSRTYHNTWTITRFSVRRTKLMSRTFSGKTFDGKRISWEYLLDTRDNRTLKMKIRPDIFPGPYASVVIGQGAETVQFSGYFGLINIELLRSAAYRALQEDGSLEMHIVVTFLDNFKNAILHPDSPQHSLAQNFADLLSSSQFSDLTVKVGQRTFHAHKAVFVARSKVFEAMFRHDMQESQRNEITIPNMDPAVFEQVLRFVYTDNVEELPRMAYELLEAAEKYDLPRLKALCEVELLNGITVNSAIKMFEFADLYRSEALKARTLQFIAGNLKKIPNWEAFCKARPDLVAEIFAETE